VETGEPFTSVKNELSMSHDLMSPLYYYCLGWTKILSLGKEEEEEKYE
jgi:hypothetical protein